MGRRADRRNGAPEHLPSQIPGWRQFRRGDLVSAWKFSFGVETSKIEEFLRKIKENQRNVGGAGRHGISVELQRGAVQLAGFRRGNYKKRRIP